MELSENTFYFWSYHIIMKFKLIDIIPQSVSGAKLSISILEIKKRIILI